MGAQHPLVVELTLVIHVILKLPQRLRRLEQLPVLVVREMVLDEQCRVGEEVEFIVAGGGKQVSSHVGGAGPGCAEGQGGPQGDFGALFGLTYPGGCPATTQWEEAPFPTLTWALQMPPQWLLP